MNKKIATKWTIHLTGAVCAAGTISLLLSFCSEVLFRNRGVLDKSLMTWEDFYGPVVTTLLAVGFLFIPFESFSFRPIRVWIGAIATTLALTVGVNVMAAPVQLAHFHADNFIIATALLSFVGVLCTFAGFYGKTAKNISQEEKPLDLPIQRFGEDTDL